MSDKNSPEKIDNNSATGNAMGLPKSQDELKHSCPKCRFPLWPIRQCKCGGGGGGSVGGSSEAKGGSSTETKARVSTLFKPSKPEVDKAPVLLTWNIIQSDETPTLKLLIAGNADVSAAEKQVLEKMLQHIDVLLKEFIDELKKDPKNEGLSFEDYKAEIKDGAILITMPNIEHQKQFIELLIAKGILPKPEQPAFNPSPLSNPFKIEFTPPGKS